jgi:hypothetical protein
MPDDELTFTVSARDMYDGIQRLESKVDLLTTAIGSLPTADHETRIRALERWRYAAGGGLALGGAAIGWLLQLRGSG